MDLSDARKKTIKNCTKLKITIKSCQSAKNCQKFPEGQVPVHIFKSICDCLYYKWCGWGVPKKSNNTIKQIFKISLFIKVCQTNIMDTTRLLVITQLLPFPYSSCWNLVWFNETGRTQFCSNRKSTEKKQRNFMIISSDLFTKVKVM